MLLLVYPSCLIWTQSDFISQWSCSPRF